MANVQGEAEKFVAPGDTLRLNYKLSSPGGQVFENTFEAEAITLTLGQGELAANLENCLIGLEINARHVFILEPAQAFGCFDARLVQRLPLTEFPPEMTLAPKALIEFHQEDRLGFWEVRGYHNDADPWKEQRFGKRSA